MPVIIITARSNQYLTSPGTGVGALMEKPLDLPRLLQTIRALLTEPPEARLARMAGQPAPFYHWPLRRESQTPEASQTTRLTLHKTHE